MVPEAIFADEAVPEAVPEGEAVPRDALEDEAVPEAVPVVEPVPEEPLPGAALPQPESKSPAERKIAVNLHWPCLIKPPIRGIPRTKNSICKKKEFFGLISRGVWRAAVSPGRPFETFGLIF